MRRWRLWSGSSPAAHRTAVEILVQAIRAVRQAQNGQVLAPGSLRRLTAQGIWTGYAGRTVTSGTRRLDGRKILPRTRALGLQ
jgi:hypothetical protein